MLFLIPSIILCVSSVRACVVRMHQTVTLRWRDSMKQRRVAIAQLLDRCHDPQWLRQQEQAGEDDKTAGATS